MSCDVLVLGGGAAGLFAAGTLSQAGVTCQLIEANPGLGKKILISGGGKCNFTNLQVEAKNFKSENHHFCKSALSRYTPQDFLREVIEGEVEYFEKKLGQLFAKTSARDILQQLEARLDPQYAEAVLNTQIKTLNFNQTSQVFEMQSQDGRRFEANNVIIATGGLSIPKIGASDVGQRIAKKFGHTLVPLLPALDGFVLSEADKAIWTELSGVSLDVIMTAGSQSFRENILFTHSGLSGPASLQCSLHWDSGKPVFINLLPDHDLRSEILKLKSSSPDSKFESLLKDLSKDIWTKRFYKTFVGQTPVIQKYLTTPLHSINDAAIHHLSGALQKWALYPTKTVGYQKAEVTRGGVKCDEISSKTMESRLQKGLYFVGEVVDVTGWLGGYNFQWAWSSAWAASQDLIAKHTRQS